MRRRELIAGLGGAAAMPLVALAQQSIPTIGFFRSSKQEGFGHLTNAFRQGLLDSGFEEGRNVTVEHHWGDDRPDRISMLATELAARKVAAIVVNYGAASAVMAATKTIPIVFVSGEDPVRGGLVASLNRPGGNVTGVTFFDTPLGGKRLGLLNELLPKQSTIALLVDPNFVGASAELRELQAAAKAMGRSTTVFNAATEGELETSFATIARSGAGAVLVGGGAYFQGQRRRLVALAAGHAIPAIYVQRQYVEVGGLMSYGASQPYAYRRAGVFVSRILKGEKPGDLPVELPSKFELVINLKTVKALGLTLPGGVLAIADEVIE